MKINRIMAAIAGLLCTAGVALALVVPQNFAPRYFASQQTHYLRFTVNFNDCTLVSNTCSVKRGAVPYNAFIKAAYLQAITAFNSATRDEVFITTATGAVATSVGGTAGGSTGALIAASAPGCNANYPLTYNPTAFTQVGNGGAGCIFGANGPVATTGAGVGNGAGIGVLQVPLVSISAGVQATGEGDTATGGNGGFDIWSQYFQAGTAATQGSMVWVIEYIAPNDGSCTNVALGATAGAC